MKLSEKKAILGGISEVPPTTKQPVSGPVSSQSNGQGGLPDGWVDKSFQGQQP